ncbi:uncharacterized protein LOC113359996 [Papaver somniferum]|uniref:uncharacterized protein LOC113359996 n=1 Tax=Papaver somniferum TaxID=3469 RepID=UPI000E6F90B3|nr:uncharacterized protein LOC113359996 [Papaver somniferum]
MSSKERYLGSPLILGHSKQEAFKNIEENFLNRFTSWSSTSLTQAGRGIMVKHVFNSIPIYQMGTFKLPYVLLSKLTSIQRKFFWGYKSHRGFNPIGWNKVRKPKDMGGMDFRDLEMLNLALLTKVAWRLLTEKDTLAVWRKLEIDIDAERNNFLSVSELTESWFSNQYAVSNEKKLFILMITSWILWKDRCDVVFQGVSLNPLNSLHRVNFYLNSHQHSFDLHTISNHSPAISRWKPPEQYTFKLNVDASFDNDTIQLGTGLVLRNFAGACQGIRGKCANRILSPEAGECLAIREALLWVKELKLGKIHIEADAMLVIQSINENSLLIQWENRNILIEIKHLSFSFCKFSFTSRDNNQVEDVVGKFVRISASSLNCLDNFSAEFCDLLAKDQNNIHQ